MQIFREMAVELCWKYVQCGSLAVSLRKLLNTTVNLLGHFEGMDILLS